MSGSLALIGRFGARHSPARTLLSVFRVQSKEQAIKEALDKANADAAAAQAAAVEAAAQEARKAATEEAQAAATKAQEAAVAEAVKAAEADAAEVCLLCMCTGYVSALLTNFSPPFFCFLGPCCRCQGRRSFIVL